MSRVFGRIVAWRARLYDRGVLPARALRHPVISVGNLTMGGTGKTPLVMELARRFREEGYRPVILSRGYRRRTRGIVIVSRGRGPEVDWRQSGDEPQMMALRLPGVAVVVGADRHRAGRRAEAENLGDLFLLDDGFQHRGLHRDVDIVTVDPAEWSAEDRLLPTGRWREPRSAIRRAHAACVQAPMPETMRDVPIPRFEVETVVDGLERNGELLPLDALRGAPLTAFAGIAKPERFFNLLERAGLSVADRIAFPDHHRFRPKDLERVSGTVAVTTEKDAVRLPGGDFHFLRVSANIRRFNELRDLIHERIRHHDARQDRDSGPQLGR